ncbi:MAG TPA: MBL fold metallo-hydrolase, partial [Candidatus Binataceae bacterium]
LIMKGRDAILVDTGIGNRLSSAEREIFDHGDGWLPGHIRALGMEPGDITHVIVSHLHFDHCGGLVRMRESGKLVAAFPRARVLVQRGELEIACYPRNERLRAAYRHVSEILKPLASSIAAIDGDTEIIAGVTATPTGGHTRDHQAAIVRDGAESFVHLADIVPTRSHMRGPWNQAYDLDALRTMEQKAEYLRRAVGQRGWISFAHDDRVFTARVKNDRGRFVLSDEVAVSERLAG